jgi:predicted ribosome quality control (RQC) complex YloA/Tae2 family protein
MAKLSMGYLDLAAWIAESGEAIKGCRVDNVYKVENTSIFLFKLRCKDKEREMLVEPGRRVHFTKYTRPKVVEGAKRFREEIRDEVLAEVSLLQNDRILVFELSGGGKLIVELVPRGVALVTDQRWRVLALSEERHFKDRKVGVGLAYSPPPPPLVSPQEAETLVKKGNLPRILNLPPEDIRALGIEVRDQRSLEEARLKVSKLLEEVSSGRVTPCLVPGVGFYVFPTEGCKKYESFNELLDDYFLELEKVEVLSEAQSQLEQERKKLMKSIEEIKNSISEYAQKEKELREMARLIIDSREEIERLLEGSKRGKVLPNKGGLVEVSLQGRKLLIDPRLSLYKNASSYFDEAKTYKEKIERSQKALEELERKLSELRLSIKDREEKVQVSIRRRYWYEKYRWSFTRNGLLAIAGRDSSQNESLVRRLMEVHDVFIHADIHGGAVTILKTQGKGFSEEDIEDASVLSACYSKAWKAGLAYVEVFWVKGEQVSLSPPSGEYLPKGSFMVYGKKNYLKKKLEIAVGLMREDAGFRVIVGSEDAVMSRSEVYAVLSPGDGGVSETASRLVKLFSRELGINVSPLLEEIGKALPGSSKLVKFYSAYKPRNG